MPLHEIDLIFDGMKSMETSFQIHIDRGMSPTKIPIAPWAQKNALQSAKLPTDLGFCVHNWSV